MTERQVPPTSGSTDDQKTQQLPTVNPTRSESRAAEAAAGSTGGNSSYSPPTYTGGASAGPGAAARGSLVHGSAVRPSAAAVSRDATPPRKEPAAGGVGGRVTEAATTALDAATAATAGARQAFREAADRAEARSRPPAPSGRRAPRRAKLTLSHINVYSVFKLACVLSIALFLVWMFAVGLLYGVLDLTGVLDQVNSAASTISGGDSTAPVVGGGLVFGVAIIIGALNIVLFIAMATIGAMVYNLCADLVGGVEVTLAERE